MSILFDRSYFGIAEGSYFTFGNVNEGIRYLLSRLPLQSKNKYEIIMYQPNASFLGVDGVAGAALSSTDDFLINKMYLRSISVPSDSFEYEINSLGTKSIKTRTPEDGVTLTFIEDQVATVQRYLSRWKSDIGEYRDGKGFVFKDNQKAAKRNALLTLTTHTGIPGFAGRFMLYGLNIKNIEEFTIGHTEEDDLMYTVQCSVDKVIFFSL